MRDEGCSEDVGKVSEAMETDIEFRENTAKGKKIGNDKKGTQDRSLGHT